MDFSTFDTRRYPSVSVKEGYGEWAATYEDTVLDLMDLALLERLDGALWQGPALDLACGTGRIGSWLRQRGVSPIDGLDLTAEMLSRAGQRGVYRRLEQGDVRSTPFDPGYALVTCSLADEHLPQVDPLYREAARLLAPGGHFVMVSYHPFFMMLNGMPTHYDRRSGEKVAIDTYVHLFSDHVRAAGTAGLQLAALEETVIDQKWMAVKPKWEKFLHRPFSFVSVWRRT